MGTSALRPDSCASCRLTRGLTAAPQEAQGKMQCLGSRTHYSQVIHTRKLKLCYRKSWGKRWFWSNLSQWLTLVSRGVCFCSALAARSLLGAASGFPTSQLDRGQPCRKRNPRASPPPGQLENIKLRDWCLERFGDKKKWDSKILTLALVNPHCKIYFNSYLPASWLPWAAAYRVFFFLLQMNSCLLLRAKCSSFFAFRGIENKLQPCNSLVLYRAIWGRKCGQIPPADMKTPEASSHSSACIGQLSPWVWKWWLYPDAAPGANTEPLRQDEEQASDLFQLRKTVE